MNKLKDSSFVTYRIDADFCVVGGGIAGVCAALSAARNGARTVLVQDRPVLGGNASSEIRMHVCGAHGADNKEAGILEEIQLENLYQNPLLVYTRWDHVMYGKCLEEENLTVLLNTSVFDLEMDGNRIAKVKTWHLHQQCFHDIHADAFADCSGDSVLRISGAHYMRGREGKDEFAESHAPDVPDRKTMGNSILIQLRETDRHLPFRPPPWAHHYTDETAPKRRMIPDGDNFWWLETGGTRDTIGDADATRDELLKIAYGVWDYIKNHPDGRGHGWELEWIGALPGKRENGRYLGDHVLCQREVEAEGRFDDIVAYGGWSMDDHHPDAIDYPGAPTIFHPAPSPYGIPYRCLYSKNIDNLFFAGRNISATHMALSSTRVMATCALLGQAVGTAAALAVATSQSPRGIYEHSIGELQRQLMDQDCWLPWHTRALPELFRNATLSAAQGDPAPLWNGVDRDLDGTDNGWWGKGDDWIMIAWDAPVCASRVRLVLDSDFSNGKRMLCNYPKDQQPVSMPPMLARDFDLETRRSNGEWSTVSEIRDNRRRLVMLALPEQAIDACRLRLKRAWGDGPSHVHAFDIS